MEKISIIVPVYNVESYLKKCIQSLLKMDVYELILIDDGSTDDSGKICDLFLQYKNVKVIHTQNQGVSKARNIGVNIATGNYLSFVDADDWVEEGYINKIQEILSDYCDIDIISFGYKKDYDVKGRNEIDVELREKYIQLDKDKIVPDFFVEGFARPVWNKVYKVDIIKEKQLSFMPFQINEDTLFNLDYLFYCKNLFLCQESYYHYMQYRNASRLSSKIYSNIFDIYLEEEERMQKLFSKWNYSDNEKMEIITETVFSQYYVSAMKIILSEKMGWFEKKKILNQAINNPLVNTVLSHKKLKNKENIVRKMLLKRQYRLIRYLLSKGK